LFRPLLGSPPALLAALLLALSPAFVRLSSTERDFVPGLCLSMLTLVLTVDLRRQHGRRVVNLLRATGLVVTTAAALLTSYFHFAFALTEVVLLLWPVSGSRAWGTRVNGLVAIALGSVLASPWYAYFIPSVLAKIQSGTTGYAEGPVIPQARVALDAVVAAVTGNATTAAMVAATLLWLVVLIAGCVLTSRTRGDKVSGSWPGPVLAIGLVLCALQVAFVLWRWQQARSFGTYVVILLPFVCAFQAVAIFRATPLWRWPLVVALALSTVGGLTWYTNMVRSVPIDWTKDAPLEYVAEHVQPGDALVFSDHARRAQYMLLSNWKATLRPPLPGYWLSATANGGCNAGIPCAVIMTSDYTEVYLHATPAEAQQTVESLPPALQRIWHIESGESANQAPLGRFALDVRAFPLWHQTINSTQLWLYIPAQMVDVESHPAITLGESVLLQAFLFDRAAQPGGTVAVGLVWTDLRPLADDYTVFVHLDDLAGHLQAQQDMQPVTGLQPTSHWKPGDQIVDHHALQLPANLPPGDYKLNVGLYRGDSRLAEPDGTNAIQLGIVHVGG
jgi:hypothetical protein